MEHSITFEPPPTDASGILLKWLVNPRDRVLVGQQLACYLLPSMSLEMSSGQIPTSSSSTLSPSDTPFSIIADRDGLVKELCVQNGDLISSGQTLLTLRSLPSATS